VELPVTPRLASLFDVLFTDINGVKDHARHEHDKVRYHSGRS